MTVSSSSRTRHSKGLLALLIFVLMFGLVGGGSVRREFLAWLVVNSQIPAPAAVEELFQSYQDPVPFLSRLWKTGKVAHRQWAMHGLKLQNGKGTALDRRIETLLTAGAIDSDASIRELALGALAQHKSPLLITAAQAQLHNPDPQLRLLGVQYLARAEIGVGLPRLIPLLDDSDLLVVTTVEAALRRWTGLDYGVRIAQSIPKRRDDGQKLPDPADMAAIKMGIERRKAWWVSHQDQYPADPVAESATTVKITHRGSPAADFALPNLNGRSVRLSSFRGKTVLLNFWATWCMTCLTEIPDLVELQKRYKNELVVLGISLDGVPDRHGHAPGFQEKSASLRPNNEDPEQHEHEIENASLDKIRAKVARVVKQRGISYTVLLDPTSAVGGRFNGGELPTNVLIDSTGHVRRRFTGARPLPVWEAMIAEVAPR